MSFKGRSMKIAKDWLDFKVIATSNGEKLEQWDNVYVLRPDPQVIWKGEDLSKFPKLHAHYHRTENKSGDWEILRKIPEHWSVHWKDFTFYCQPMNFKHMALFPEQAVNWEILYNTIKSANREVRVLNLFAYTGGARVVCAKAGASVTHVDAAKSMIDIAKKNAELNGLNNIRFIMDDCKKFVEKEIRRGKTYDIIIMDPPSFGRGPNGEVWKIEDDIYDFINLVKQVVSDKPIMVLVNSYTTGLQPTVMANILNSIFKKGEVEAYDLAIPTDEQGIYLPCGCTAIKRF